MTSVLIRGPLNVDTSEDRSRDRVSLREDEYLQGKEGYQLSEETNPVNAFNLGFPASRAVRNIFLLK